MKTLIALAVFATASWAEDGNTSRRLESVSWNPVKHQLEWVVSKGAVEEGGYKANVRQQYSINMDEATMSFTDETRRFSKEEAQSVRRLLDLLSRYAAESTIWWEEGQGEPLTKSERVSLPPAKSGTEHSTPALRRVEVSAPAGDRAEFIPAAAH